MEKHLKIELNYKDHYSYGMLHSGFSLFDFLYIENLTDEKIGPISVELAASADFIVSGKIAVDFLAPFGHKVISCDFVQVDDAFFSTLGSVLNAGVSIVISNSAGEELGRENFPCKLLPYQYFSGLGNMPESLAMFVTPAQEELNLITNIGVFSDSLDLCQQIYDEIKSKKITFSSDDFSGSVSLSVRLCERVLTERVASPLELSLLFASACERVGLSPVIAFSGKNKFYGGFSDGETSVPLLRQHAKGNINLDDLHLIDCNYFAFGSELNFDSALFHSKNSLSLSDDKITVLGIRSARDLGILPLPNRSGTVLLHSNSREESKSGAFSDYYDLLQEHSDEPIVTSVLTGNRIPAEGRKSSYSFDFGLDVNQNKVLGKILSNNFSLIRAQMGSGISTIFSKAATHLLKSGKSVLYITDPLYHSGRFLSRISRYFDTSFVLDLTENQNYYVQNFDGVYENHENIFHEIESVKKCLDKMDTYYSHLEGDKKIVSSFIMASDRYHQLRDANDAIIFSPEQVGMLSDDMVQKWFFSVNDIIKVVSDIGTVSDNPLQLVRQKSFTYEYKSKLIRQLEEILHCIERITTVREQLLIFFPSLNDIRSYNTFYAFQDLIRLFSEFENVPQSFFINSINVEDHFKKVTQLIQAKKENESIIETIQISFEKDIFDIDASDLYSRFLQIKFDKSIKSIALKHSIFKNIKKFLKPNCDVENVEYILSRLDIYQKNSAFIHQEKNEVFTLLSVPLGNGEADWEHLQVAADLCYQAYSVYLGVFQENRLADFASDFRAASETGGVMEKLLQLRELSEEYITLKENFEITVSNHLDFYYPEASARGMDYFSVIHEKLLSVFSTMDHLKSWCGWLAIREDALGLGLKNVINVVESGKIRIDELRKAFLRAFFKSVCEFNFISHPDLIPENLDFTAIHSEFLQHSKEYDQLYKAQMNSVLSTRRLDALSTFRGEALTPVDMLEQDSKLFSDVFPLVVSDLPTARKMFAKRKKMFDLVLIEDRGYLPISDLLWVFSAGKSVAYAGALSSAQMIKKSTFDLSASAFDYLWKISDEKYSLSALYDGASSIRAFKASLSKAIASDSRAYSAPSPNVDKRWDWVRVSGSFDSEYPCANFAEADYCVDSLLKFVSLHENETIGVITATNEQKNLVLRILAQKLRQREEELPHRFAEKVHVFSIYEDMYSCDHIIFSATFSSDRSLHGSRLSYKALQFGGADPKRMIQSIVSCAKKSLVVLTSFGMDELKFTPSLLPNISAFHLLLKLLSAPVANNSYSLVGTLDNTDVIHSIRNELISRGYSVLSGVQSGRYYLDLAVFGLDGSFALGIISDQTVLNQQSNLSSIEIANQILYENDGWQIYRVRSPLTFDSFENELEAILSLLQFSNSDQELI